MDIPVQDRIVATITCRLAHKIRYSYIVFDDDQPDFLAAQATPDFTQFNHQIADDCVVYNIFELAASAYSEGSFWILTCECGIPDDTEIYAPIEVFHEADTICWKIPLWQYPDIIDGYTQEYGQGDWLKLVFKRTQYIQAAQAMQEDIRYHLQSLIPFRMLKESDCTRAYHFGKQLPDLKNSFPDCRLLQIETFNPYDYDRVDTLLDAETLEDLLK